MQKMFVVFVALVALAAHADNIVTSREYVDTQAKVLQDALPAKNEDTVLTYGATSEQGNKAIYDASANYIEQTEALVTAGQFNTAVQNALESEFVCIERQNGNGGCLLYEIRGATQQQILPAGYTRLEYIGSNGEPYINTQKPIGKNFEIWATVMLLNKVDRHFLLGSTGANYHDFYVGVYSDVLLNSGISNAVYAGGIRYPDTNVKFTFGISPQWTENYTGGRTMLSRPYKGNSNLLIGHTANLTGTPARYYSVKMYNDGVLNGNFIPAQRDSDGEIGMYDLVSGTFFTNAGSGEFVAGPVATSNIYLPSGN